MPDRGARVRSDAASLATAGGRPQRSEGGRAHGGRPSLGLAAGNQRARQLAEWVLSDEKEAVRAAGAEALGQIGLPAAAPALKKALKDESAEVVFSAAGALFELKDPAAYEVYFAVLTGERKSGEGLVQSQLDMLKDPQALAKIGFETGIGFIPFGGIGYKAVKAFTSRQDIAGARGRGAEAGRGPRPEDRAGAGQRVEGRQVDGPGGRGQRTRQARRPQAGRRDRAAARRRAGDGPLQRGGGRDPVDP